MSVVLGGSKLSNGSSGSVSAMEHEFFVKHEQLLVAQENVARIKAELAAILKRVRANQGTPATRRAKRLAVTAAKASSGFSDPYDVLQDLIRKGEITDGDAASVTKFRDALKPYKFAPKKWVDDDAMLSKRIRALMPKK